MCSDLELWIEGKNWQTNLLPGEHKQLSSKSCCPLYYRNITGLTLQEDSVLLLSLRQASDNT